MSLPSSKRCAAASPSPRGRHPLGQGCAVGSVGNATRWRVALWAYIGRISDVVSTVEAAAAEPDFWSIHDIQFHCRIGRTRAWELVHESGFPPPIAIGARRIWPRSEVLAFLDTCRQPCRLDRPTAEAEQTPYVIRRVGSRS